MSQRVASPIESSFDHGLREPQDPQYHQVDVRHLKKEHVDKAVEKMLTVIPDLKPHEFFFKDFLSAGRPLTADHKLAPIAKTLPVDTLNKLFSPTLEELEKAGITSLVVDPAAPLASDTYDANCILAVANAIAQAIALAGTAIGVIMQWGRIARALSNALRDLPAATFTKIRDLLKLIYEATDKIVHLKSLFYLLYNSGLLGIAFGTWASDLSWWRILFDLATVIANVSLWFVSDGAALALAIACVLLGILSLAEAIVDVVKECKLKVDQQHPDILPRPAS